ncbi:hypothetical protein R50345_22750 [Paenibacillus sp. FSL R5-0345]|uniref:hypothetical protein n=1 Tax=Paenibacillus sp. FSL R5-0345 TaxID=1536770 RepID=UPI0004F814AD|nr:hypothetical protein [Paenibacillus sp. FSL R5-0345]AIQ37207.1 hypothetical protein R50345_22750 [Paenibacillus sp. FSL R5-0345]
MKIDTLELETMVALSSETLSILKSTDHHTYHHNDNKDYLCYRYTLEGFPCKVTVKYTVQNQKLKVCIPSLPKLVTGSSVMPLNDSNRYSVYSTIEGCLGSIGIEADPIPEWTVRRMDTYHDFQVGDQVTAYIVALSKVRIAKYKTKPVAEESVYFSCDSKQHYFYDKQNKLFDECGVTQEDIERSKGILRYEVRHKTDDFYRDKSIDSHKFGDLSTDKVTGALIAKYFNMLPTANLRVSSANEAQRKLADLYGAGAAIRLMGFIDAYGRNALDGISRRTQIRYLNELKTAGVSPILGMVDLPPLTLPFSANEATISDLTKQTEENGEYRRLLRTPKSRNQRDKK